MQNKILSITRNIIPYVKELRQLKLVKSVASAILMQQLDYWFDKYPDGFYKFMQPCPTHKAYKEGDSWVEELAFSSDEFRTAFDAIGKRYTSKSTWKQAQGSFDGMYYCSYHDKKDGLTWYFRNHAFVDSDLDELCAAQEKPLKVPKIKPFLVNGQSQSTVNGQPQFTEMGNPDLQKLAIPTYRDGQPQSTLLYTEITPETTSEITLSQSERERFEKFVKDNWPKEIHSMRAFLADKEYFDEWYSKFLASPTGRAAKQEAIAAQYDWGNDPRFDEWLRRAFYEGRAWVQENEAEREQRNAFLEWAQLTDPYKGRLY